jgi:DNA polymerase III subunit epsilon
MPFLGFNNQEGSSMYLAFDTETTGLPRPHYHPAHPAQPHLLQFAGVIFDEHGREIDSLFTLVKPGPGAVLVPEAFNAHGISLQQASREGTEPLNVLHWFKAKASTAKLIIGHNLGFDLQVMATVSARLTGLGWKPHSPLFCTMAHSTPIVNLPPTSRMIAAGRHHPKSPSLAECVEHFFGEALIGAHDAAADVRACIRVFRHLTAQSAVA